MSKKTLYTDKLHSWFGANAEGTYEIIYSWFEPKASAPTLFATVKHNDKLLFMRVANTVGKLQVNVDYSLVDSTKSIDYSGCLDDALRESGFDDNLIYDIRIRFEQIVKENGGDI